MDSVKAYALKLLRWKLKKLAQLTIWRYRPGIVAVTGSAGKTSTKLAVAAVIAAERTVRASHGNFNNELGVPLTILGDYEKIDGVLFWPKVILRALWNVIVAIPYPDILVLEYGIDHPGDMKELVSIARPNVGIITSIGDPPVHVEFFESADALAREKSRLIECLTASDFAVLNADSKPVMKLRERTRARTVTFGFDEGADLRITDFSHVIKDNRPLGVRFTLMYAGIAVSVELPNVLGTSYALAAAAGASVGLIFGMKLPKIVGALTSFRPAPSRMELVNGQKDTLILNDAYNANPLSVQMALDTLRDLPGKRKVAVLGDMRELGAYGVAAHEAVGRKAAGVVNVLMTVGVEAKIIAEEARKSGLRKNMIMSFETTDEALLPVQDMLRKGDLVLVKGSNGVHLEELVEQVRAK